MPRQPLTVPPGVAAMPFPPVERARIGALRREETNTSTEREQADALLEAALRESGARDPREFYRDRLRELKERDKEAYAEAVRYYEQTLIPSIASRAEEALTAWTEYGRKLAELTTPGRTVAIDRSGRAGPYASPAAREALVLHLPRAAGARALLVGLPAELSDAQRATYDWLVMGRLKLRDGE